MLRLNTLFVSSYETVVEALCGLNQVMPRNITHDQLPLELRVSIADTVWNYF